MDETLYKEGENTSRNEGYILRILELCDMHVLMEKIAILFTFITAILHLFFFVLETFLWQTDYSLKVFKMNKEKAEASVLLASNQGVYNGLLALGLLFSLVMPESFGYPIRIYCLSFVFIVGSYGALTVSRRVFWIQAFPALLALILFLFHASI